MKLIEQNEFASLHSVGHISKSTVNVFDLLKNDVNYQGQMKNQATKSAGFDNYLNMPT